MRYFLILTCLLCVLTCASAALAGPIADSLAFQGRLTDLSDNPVPDGPRDMIISLWTDSVGGTMLHSEIVVVTVSKGLYSTCIGCGSSSFFDIFTDQPMFLQTQLAGQSPMAPRIRMRNTPRALVSSRVRGDVATAPGMMVVGDSTTGGYAKVNAGLHAAGSALAQGASLITHDCDDTDASAYFGHSQGSNVGVVSLRSTADSTDLSISQSDPSGESGMSMKGKNIRKNISVTLFRRESSSSRSVGLSADTGSSSILLDCDDDGDGISESSISSACDASSSSQVQEKKGLNAVNVKLARTISSPPGGPVAVDALDMDSDDDGVMDVSSTDSVDASGARQRLVAHNIGSSGQDGVDIQLSALKKGGFVKVTASQNSQSLRCSSSADSVAATMNVDSDHDGDGTPECQAEAAASDKFAQVRGFKVEISGRTSSFGTVCDSNGVSSSLDMDDDGDGTPEGSYGVSLGIGVTAVKGTFTVPARSFPSTTTETSATEHDGVCRVSTDSDDDGLSDADASLMVTPTTSSVAINTKGTGADKNRVIGSTDDSSAVVLLATDDASITMKTRKGGMVNGSITINNGSALRMVDVGSDGNGYFATAIGVGVDPTHAVEVAGGAYCDGTTWVNASDMNSKENFEPVDGEMLLEKISGLEITKWNYKGNTESEHIGPTAQDFQATFGVGSDGKSISTIDPSGIALAAIKELNKQNQELKVQSQDLKEQNKRLQKQLDELRSTVEALAAKK